jgi:hypothetical protein
MVVPVNITVPMLLGHDQTLLAAFKTRCGCDTP